MKQVYDNIKFIQRKVEYNDDPDETKLNFKIANVTIIDDLNLITKIFKTSNQSSVNQNTSLCLINVTFHDKKTLFDFKNLSHLNSSDLELAISAFETVINKDHICYTCLNKLSNLKEIQLEIKNLKIDIINVFSKTLTKQKLVEKTSEKINSLNFIKVQLSSLQSELNLLKKFNCKNFDENNKISSYLLKWTSSLVETIQNAIRKTNLNINFLIIL